MGRATAYTPDAERQAHAAAFGEAGGPRGRFASPPASADEPRFATL